MSPEIEPTNPAPMEGRRQGSASWDVRPHLSNPPGGQISGPKQHRTDGESADAIIGQKFCLAFSVEAPHDLSGGAAHRMNARRLPLLGFTLGDKCKRAGGCQKVLSPRQGTGGGMFFAIMPKFKPFLARTLTRLWVREIKRPRPDKT